MRCDLHTQTDRYFYVLDELINKFAYESCEWRKKNYFHRIAIAIHCQSAMSVRSSIGRRRKIEYVWFVRSNELVFWCCSVHSAVCMCFAMFVAALAAMRSRMYGLWIQCPMRSIFIWPMTVNTNDLSSLYMFVYV